MFCINDFLTTYPQIVLGDFLRYAIFTLIGAGVIWGLKPAILIGRRIQNRVAQMKDIKREILFSLSTVLVFALNGYVVHLGIQHDFLMVYQEAAEFGWIWFALSLPAIIIAHDAWFYWTHRAMHHPKLFRIFHRTHHKSHTPTVFAAYAFDPAEAMVQAIFFPIYLAIVPTHPIMMFVFLMWMMGRNVMGHAGFEVHPKWWTKSLFTRWNNSTTHHDLHHSSAHYNFGLYFPFWDRVMGTEHPDYLQRFDEVVAHPPAPKGKALPKLVAVALIGLLATAGIAYQAKADEQDIRGLWLTGGASSLVDLQPCADDADAFCGTIVWLWEAEGADGQPLKDEQNPDKGLKTRPVIGINLLSGFKPKGDGIWSGGKIYNPADGRSYNASIRDKNAEELIVEGCVLFICQKQFWRRPSSIPRDANDLAKQVAAKAD